MSPLRRFLRPVRFVSNTLSDAYVGCEFLRYYQVGTRRGSSMCLRRGGSRSGVLALACARCEREAAGRTVEYLYRVTAARRARCL